MPTEKTNFQFSTDNPGRQKQAVQAILLIAAVAIFNLALCASIFWLVRWEYLAGPFPALVLFLCFALSVGVILIAFLGEKIDKAKSDNEWVKKIGVTPIMTIAAVLLSLLAGFSPLAKLILPPPAYSGRFMLAKIGVTCSALTVKGVDLPQAKSMLVVIASPDKEYISKIRATLGDSSSLKSLMRTPSEPKLHIVSADKNDEVYDLLTNYGSEALTNDMSADETWVAYTIPVKAPTLDTTVPIPTIFDRSHTTRLFVITKQRERNNQPELSSLVAAASGSVSTNLKLTPLFEAKISPKRPEHERFSPSSALEFSLNPPVGMPPCCDAMTIMALLARSPSVNRAIFLFISLWPTCALTQPIVPCVLDASPPAELLRCVREYSVSKPNNTSILPDWVKAGLRKLAQTNGYDGLSADLDVLKQRSAELKRDPNTNREAISLLDSAIASHVDEIGPAVSTQGLANVRDVGTDIYPEFIRQKVRFLGSEKAKFYDGGPFEITWRSLFVSALESEYFLNDKTIDADKKTLRRAIEVLDEILVRRRGPDTKYGYLADRGGPLLNGDRFWRASLFFLLGEKDEVQNELRALVLDNQRFGLEVEIPPGTESSRHIYIYKIFYVPHQILVQADERTDGGRKTEAKDADIVDRYYNAAQLALCACAHLDEAGSTTGIKAFATEIKNLELSDYYVIAGSADSPAAIRALASSLEKKLDSEAISGKRDQLVRQFAKEAQRFSETISRGASKCGISNDVRDQIYSNFDFRVFTANISGLEKRYLLLGGRLNADQANAVAEFLNRTVHQMPETGDSGGKNINRAYVARMRIAR